MTVAVRVPEPTPLTEEVDGTTVRLGTFLDNTRRRAAELSPERRADLDALGMRRS